MKKIGILVFATLTVSACTNDEIQAKRETKTGDTVIKGHVMNGTGQTLILEERASAVASTVIDSLSLSEKGDFEFTFEVAKPGFYRLKLANNNGINLILNKKETLKIEADASDLAGTYTVDGSAESSRLRKLNIYLANMYQTGDSLNTVMRSHQMNRDYQSYTAAVAQRSVLQARIAYFVKSFIDKDSASLASLAAVETLNLEQDFEYYKKVVDGLRNVVPDASYYIQLKQRVEETAKLATGAVAPELVMNDVNGNPFKLSQLQGKVVLVDFWASWCKPCRVENPNVVRTYNKYKDKGFTVLSVSLDGMPNQQNPKQRWMDAIKQDGLLWENHVSELRGWQSSFIKTYRIQGIPLTFLLDKEGKILAKNLRGPQLEQKLVEIFGE